MSIDNSRALVTPPRKPDSWHYSAVGTFKLNFDGVAKGNLGSVGYGGGIHNTKGKGLRVFWGDLGETTNNVAELEGLVSGLRWAPQQS